MSEAGLAAETRTPTPPEAEPSRNPFHSSGFARWWLASLVAGTGVGIQTVTVPLNQLLYAHLLRKGAWAWAGLPELDLSFLALVSSIAVMAAEMVSRSRISPTSTTSGS